MARALPKPITCVVYCHSVHEGASLIKFIVLLMGDPREIQLTPATTLIDGKRVTSYPLFLPLLTSHRIKKVDTITAMCYYI